MAPYHAAYRSFAPISEAQRASIIELCRLPNGNFICHFCPNESTDFIPYSDFPLQEDQLYSSAEELHSHVALYHYAFVHVYQCGFCQGTIAVFPTWSQLEAHFYTVHDGLRMCGRVCTPADLVATLAFPEGRSRHPIASRVIFNVMFIPPRRLPFTFPRGTGSSMLLHGALG